MIEQPESNLGLLEDLLRKYYYFVSNPHDAKDDAKFDKLKSKVLERMTK